MSAKTRSEKNDAKRGTLRSLSEQGVSAARKTIVTLGDLVSAACEVSGSADAAVMLLSPISPLARLLNRRIVFA